MFNDYVLQYCIHSIRFGSELVYELECIACMRQTGLSARYKNDIKQFQQQPLPIRLIIMSPVKHDQLNN